MLLRELEPEKYWSFPSNWSKEKREDEISYMISSRRYSFQLKTDGNYSAFCCDFDGDKRLITRGKSVKTGEYGIISDKVFFFEALSQAFEKPTRLIGEIYFDRGIDKHVGSVLRSSTHKALSIQDKNYYQEISKTIKFSAKDKRDIENNEFFNIKLKMRIFDCWYFEGKNLLEEPWIKRQEYVLEAVKKINHPLISAVKFKAMDELFYDELFKILTAGGEGVVAYLNSGKVEPGKRTARKTLKIKQELSQDIDCFIYGTEPAAEAYTGKEIGTWKLWKNIQTDEMLYGEYFGAYQDGSMSIIPVSKGHFYGWPGAIYCAVFDENHKPYVICKCAGLTEDFKEELKNDYNKYHMMPIKITGMMVSESEGYSIRHPKLVSLRENDISVEDCTLEKIKAQS